jgi:ribosomal protein L11
VVSRRSRSRTCHNADDRHAANAHEVAHAVTKQDLLRIADAELADSSSDEQHAVMKVIEAVCWFTGDNNPLSNAPSQAVF